MSFVDVFERMAPVGKRAYTLMYSDGKVFVDMNGTSLYLTPNLIDYTAAFRAAGVRVLLKNASSTQRNA